MSRFLLDANHASPLVTLRHSLRMRILEDIAAGHSFLIAAPVLTETLFGMSMLPRAEQNLAEWQKLKPHIGCIAIQESDAEDAAKLPQWDTPHCRTERAHSASASDSGGSIGRV